MLRETAGAPQGSAAWYESWRDRLYGSGAQIPEVALALVERVRDLTVVHLGAEFSLVIACDSNAGFGEKPHDGRRQAPEETGLRAVKVPLMEVMASGAVPVSVIDALCVEMDPTGRRIIAGVREAVVKAGLPAERVLNGSTEDNIPTVQTGMGVTVIGLVRQGDMLLGQAGPGHLVAAVGWPKSGRQVPYSEEDPEICRVETVRTLVGTPGVREIVPVGSHGARYEAELLARGCGARIDWVDDPVIPLAESGGTSTCVLIAVEPEGLAAVKRAVSQPVHVLGRLLSVREES